MPKKHPNTWYWLVHIGALILMVEPLRASQASCRICEVDLARFLFGPKNVHRLGNSAYNCIITYNWLILIDSGSLILILSELCPQIWCTAHRASCETRLWDVPPAQDLGWLESAWRGQDWTPIFPSVFWPQSCSWSAGRSGNAINSSKFSFPAIPCNA